MTTKQRPAFKGCVNTLGYMLQRAGVSSIHWDSQKIVVKTVWMVGIGGADINNVYKCQKLDRKKMAEYSAKNRLNIPAVNLVF